MQLHEDNSKIVFQHCPSLFLTLRPNLLSPALIDCVSWPLLWQLKYPLGYYDIIPLWPCPHISPYNRECVKRHSTFFVRLVVLTQIFLSEDRERGREHSIPLQQQTLHAFLSALGTHNRNPEAYLKFHLILLIIVKSVCQTQVDGSQALPAILGR